MSERTRRTSQLRKLKTTVLIVCEGRETERNYLDGFKRQEIVNRHFAITVVRGKGGSRCQIVDHAINKKSHHNKEFDRVFCVLDTEALESTQANDDLTAARHAAAEKEITLFISNPAFEVWLLAHFVRTSRCFMNCAAVVTKLNNKWRTAFGQEYAKSDNSIYQKVASRTDDAISNARAVAEIDHGGIDVADRNSSTDFYLLVERLRSGGGA